VVYSVVERGGECGEKLMRACEKWDEPYYRMRTNKAGFIPEEEFLLDFKEMHMCQSSAVDIGIAQTGHASAGHVKSSALERRNIRRIRFQARAASVEPFC
jgi:hypothetical protein